MRILFVTYHFPPDATIGSVRPYQFARQLQSHGIEPWILTVEPQYAQYQDDCFPPEGIPPSHIYRTPVLPSRLNRLLRIAAPIKRLRKGQQQTANCADSSQAPARQDAQTMAATKKSRLLAWLMYPDYRAGWLQPATSAAKTIIEEQKIAAVFSTSPPRITHLIARQIAARYRMPWIMDLRDPWYGHWEAEDNGSPTLERLYGRLFRQCGRQADAVILNTERLRSHMCAKYSEIAEKAVTIPNGCTQTPLASFAASQPPQFAIGYYGNLTAQRNAETFLRGLRLWLDRTQVDAADLAVRFVGPDFEPGSVYPMDALGLRSLVRLCPPVPRPRVPDLMREEYVLLLVANNQPFQVPGKVYEYLASGRRILATTEHDSATADLLRGQPGCFVAQTPEEVARALETYWQEYQRGASAEVDYGDLLEENSYCRRTEQLAELIHRLGEKHTT